MKNILHMFNLENLKSNIKNIITRFPIWVILIFIITILFIINVDLAYDSKIKEDIFRVIFSLIITFFFSISVYISSENQGLKCLQKNLFQIIPLVFWIFFYISFKSTIDSFENIVFLLLSLTWIMWYLFFAPYIKNLINFETEQTVYYTYFYKISVVFLTSIILWLVLFILWNIAIFAIINLFDLSWINESKIVWYWSAIALSFITPLFALTQIPNKKTYSENHFNENAFFSFLIKYIATPFIYVYFIILYAYSVKVLSNFWDWPKWEVTWLVIWFSTFGYIIYIFSYIFEETNNFIKTFRKWFPYVVIPQLFMLFYAIYLRINQYDITINRYFVVVFWIWLFVLSIYFIVSKIKHLSTIPIVLTIFTIIISVWPWSVYNLPESRQYNRLIINLEKAWILKDNKIIPLNNENDIAQDLSKDIHSWVTYVCDFNDCEKIKKLFDEQYQKLLEKEEKEFEQRKIDDLKYFENDEEKKKEINDRKYTRPYKWQITSFINNEIKVKSYFNIAENSEYININLKNDIFPIDVSWYSKILSIDNYKDSDKKNYWYINIWLNKIDIIWDDWNISDTVNIKNITDNLINKYKNNNLNNYQEKNEDLTFLIWDYKIIFSSLSIKNPDYKWVSTYNNNYANWYILIK